MKIKEDSIAVLIILIAVAITISVCNTFYCAYHYSSGDWEIYCQCSSCGYFIQRWTVQSQTSCPDCGEYTIKDRQGLARVNWFHQIAWKNEEYNKKEVTP